MQCFLCRGHGCLAVSARADGWPPNLIILTQNTSTLPSVTQITDAAKEAQAEVQEIAQDVSKDAQEAVKDAQDKINEITESVSKTAGETTESAKEEVKEAETKATDAAENVEAEAKDTADKAGDKVDEVAEDAKVKKPNAIKRLSMSFKKFVKNVTN